jgi:putative transposase
MVSLPEPTSFNPYTQLLFALGNERLWRSVKYEDVYIRDYETVPQVIAGMGKYFRFYNRERLHQALDYKTPEAVYRLTA